METVNNRNSKIGFVKKNSNRIRLEENIPLKFPLALTIEPTNKCNYSCRFCPNGYEHNKGSKKRPVGMMDIDIYKKVIMDIQSSRTKIKSLALHKNGEPLLHPYIDEMVAIAKKSGCFENITITTNGSLLTKRISEKLIDSGLDFLRISVESIIDEKYKWLTKTKYNASRIYENVAYFRKLREKKGLDRPWIYVKMVAFPKVKDELEDFKILYNQIADEVNIESPMNWDGSGNFLEEVDPNNECQLNDVYGYYSTSGNKGEKVCCPLPWYHMSVNFNGSVSVCGVDYKNNTIIGDVNKQHLINDIWRGKKLMEFKKMHVYNKKYLNESCSTCQFLNTYPDNIDNFVRDNPEKALKLI